MEAVTWLKENVPFEDNPVPGSTYITPEGKFVNLSSAGMEHLDLLKKMEEFGIHSEEDEVIPGLQSNGWIRCNEGNSGGYAYLEVREIKPTPEQFAAISKWADFVLTHRNEVSVIYITDEDFEEETYGRFVSGRQIADSIRRVYSTGKLIPAIAFESVKKVKALDLEKLEKLGIVSGEEGNFYNKEGVYVGNPDFVKVLADRQISPEKAQPDHGVCSIGFSDKDQKWYGWSHRAIYGFGVGHKCKAGDCGVADGNRIGGPWYPKPGFVCKDLEDCKKCAIAFADSVD